MIVLCAFHVTGVEVLMNSTLLFVNAFHVTPEGAGPWVRVTCKEDDL